MIDAASSVAAAATDPTGPYGLWLAVAGVITALAGMFGGAAALVAAIGAFRRHKAAAELAADQPPAADLDDHDELWRATIEQLEAANASNAELQRQLADANRRAAAANSRADRAQNELIEALRSHQADPRKATP